MNSTGERVALMIAISILAGLSFAIGLCIGTVPIERMEKEAIEKGFAEYNQQTGDWQWKEKP